MISSNLVEVERLSFSYRVGDRRVEILRDLDFTIRAGEFTAIQGPSGSGKSTFFYLLGCLLKPSAGKIVIAGRDVTGMNEDERAIFRNRHIGFVFQQFHLLPRASVLDNILLPTQYPAEWADFSAVGLAAKRERALGLATRLGLEPHLDQLPNQLSGGQQQRVAIARALMNDTQLILADEPTGNLDSKSADQLLNLFRELNSEGKTIVLITHDSEVASRCDRVHHFKDGVFVRTEDRGARKGGGFPSVTAGEPVGSGASALKLFRSTFPLARENLSRNKAKSLLTMLGVVIGVSAVTAMVTLGQFAKARILEGYEALGVNTMSLRGYPNWKLRASDIVPVPFSEYDPVKDLEPLRTVFPSIIGLTPVLNDHSSLKITSLGRSIDNDVELMGVSPEAFKITGRELIQGTKMNPYHVQFRSPLCWIGYEIAKQLFLRVDPIGQILQLASGDSSSMACRVAGVLEHIETNSERLKPDMQVILPYTTFQSFVSNPWSRGIRNVLIQLEPGADVERVGKGIEKYFDRRYGKAGVFSIGSDSKLIAQMKKFLNIFTLLLASISLLSLVVGGIGINNMMLVSITERLKEFGLRKSLGATHRSIRMQMLVESCLLCAVAGATGLFLGFAAYEGLIFLGSQVIPKLKFEWVVEPWAAALSVLSIGAVGILSGIAPAVRAEKLEVIEALRSE